MEKEKLRDKLFDFKSLFKLENFSIDNILLFFIFLCDFFAHNISTLILLLLLFFLGSNLKFVETKKQYILSMLYLVIPTYLHISILNSNIINKDLILWLFLLLFIIKITIYLFNNIFDDITDTKKYSFFGLGGAILVSILIGIIGSLFLKQKLIVFIILNIIMAITIYIQYLLNRKINISFENILNKYILKLSSLHSNFSLIFLILIIYLYIFK